MADPRRGRGRDRLQARAYPVAGAPRHDPAQARKWPGLALSGHARAGRGTQRHDGRPRAGTEEAARWQAVAAELEAEIGELRIGLVRAEERAAAGERIAVAELAAKETVIVELREMLADARRPWLERLLAAIRR